MAATDILTLDEAKAHLATQVSARLEGLLAVYISAITSAIEDVYGPVVKRTITDEEHRPQPAIVSTSAYSEPTMWSLNPSLNSPIFLRQRPVLAVTAVKEYSGGVLQTLAVETAAASSSADYLFDADQQLLLRRAGWIDTNFASTRVLVTYDAGRFAATANVEPKWKLAAGITLTNLWRREQGAGTQTFGEYGPGPVPTFALPWAALEVLGTGGRKIPTVA